MAILNVPLPEHLQDRCRVSLRSRRFKDAAGTPERHCVLDAFAAQAHGSRSGHLRHLRGRVDGLQFFDA